MQQSGAGAKARLWCSQESTRVTLRILGAIVGAYTFILGILFMSSGAFGSFNISLISIMLQFFVYGSLILLSETRNEFLLSGVRFLRGYVGRGSFYIFVAIASLGYSSISGGNKTIQFTSYLAFSGLLVIGILNILIGCCFPPPPDVNNAPDKEAANRANVKEGSDRGV